MARYRIRVWLKDNPRIEAKATRKSACKLCIIGRAQTIAKDMASIRHIDYTAIGWTVEVLTGAPGEWDIIWHQGKNDGGLALRHGH
jgi:hypothetical protein